MITRKSNKWVELKIHPDFRRWAKMESARRGKSIISFSEEFAKEQLKGTEKNNGFKINF